MASSAAWTARSSPRADPMPMRAEPAPCMTDLTSAKSRLIRPGVVIRSVMPCTPDSSTWSAERNASIIETLRSLIESSRSLGMTMRVSTSSRRDADARLGLVGTTAALERERAGDDAYRQGTEAAGDTGHDRRAARASAATLTRGHEDHVGALEDLLDLLGVVLRSLLADLGIRTCAQTARQLAPDVELDVGITHQQRLRVRVDRDELDALEADLDHAVDGVDATAADADDLDDGQVVLRCCCHESGPSLMVNVLGDGSVMELGLGLWSGGRAPNQ